jgi:hypothetical protein
MYEHMGVENSLARERNWKLESIDPLAPTVTSTEDCLFTTVST